MYEADGSAAPLARASLVSMHSLSIARTNDPRYELELKVLSGGFLKCSIKGIGAVTEKLGAGSTGAKPQYAFKHVKELQGAAGR